MYFWSHWLRKMWLDKYLKRSFSEDHSRSNMVNVLKHCSKLNGSTFTVLIHPCEGNSSLKSFSEWYAKSQDCLLTHWHLITSIFFLIETLYSNIFRCSFLRNEKNFLNWFLHFPYLDPILNFFKKKMPLIAHVFLSLQTARKVVK